MPLPTDYTNATALVDVHPDAHNDTNVAVNDLDTRVTAIEDSTDGDIPAGGTAGQVLTKDTSTDYDTSWQTAAGGGIPSGSAGGDLTGSYPNPTIGALKVTTAALANGAVDNGKIANMPTGTVKGRADVGTSGAPNDLDRTALTGLVNFFSSSTAGKVSGSGGGTTNYLRVDGTWAAPPGSGTTDHGALTGLTDDDHVGYARLAGRTGGQTLNGGTDDADTLTVKANAGTNAANIAITSLGGVTVGGGLATVAVSPSLTLTGAATVSTTLGVTGAATLGSTLGVTGATTLSSTLAVTSTVTAGATTLTATSGTGAAFSTPFSIVGTATNDDVRYVVGQARMTTINATIATLGTVAVPTDSIIWLECDIVARCTGGAGAHTGDFAYYKVGWSARNAGGTMAQAGAMTTLVTNESTNAATWAPSMDVTGTSIRVRVTGGTSDDVVWHGTARWGYVGT